MVTRRTLPIAAALLLLFAPRFHAQRAAAPDDLTGYWVSEVTEKWRFRMLVPDKNDYTMVPLNPEGRRVAALWDPAKDQASGEACRGYGGAAILQVPGRLHITWQDDNTLRMDADSGTQTRLFHFSGSPSASEKPSWQGHSAGAGGGDHPQGPARGRGRPGEEQRGKAGLHERKGKARRLSQGRDDTAPSRL